MSHLLAEYLLSNGRTNLGLLWPVLLSLCFAGTLIVEILKRRGVVDSISKSFSVTLICHGLFTVVLWLSVLGIAPFYARVAYEIGSTADNTIGLNYAICEKVRVNQKLEKEDLDIWDKGLNKCVVDRLNEESFVAEFKQKVWQSQGAALNEETDILLRKIPHLILQPHIMFRLKKVIEDVSNEIYRKVPSEGETK